MLNLRKTLTVLFALVISTGAYSQVVNRSYFPADNALDAKFNELKQEGTNTAEWLTEIANYTEVWKTQMNKEMNRLISVVPGQKKAILKAQESWLQNLETNKNLAAATIDMNKIGRESRQNFDIEIMYQYRERAIYYFTLYYTNREHKDKKFDPTANFVLAE